MEIEWASICKEIEDTEEGWNVYGINQDGWLLDAPLPTTITVTILIVLSNRAEEVGEQHRLRYRVISPDGNASDAEPFHFRAEGTNPFVTGEKKGRLTIPGGLTIGIARDGDYEIQILLDDAEPGVSLPLYVRPFPSLDP